MISVEEMKKQILNAPRYRYSGSWPEKVGKMSDKQIMAIYFRFKREGIIWDS